MPHQQPILRSLSIAHRVSIFIHLPHIGTTARATNKTSCFTASTQFTLPTMPEAISVPSASLMKALVAEAASCDCESPDISSKLRGWCERSLDSMVRSRLAGRTKSIALGSDQCRPEARLSTHNKTKQNNKWDDELKIFINHRQRRQRKRWS